MLRTLPLVEQYMQTWLCFQKYQNNLFCYFWPYESRILRTNSILACYERPLCRKPLIVIVLFKQVI